MKSELRMIGIAALALSAGLSGAFFTLFYSTRGPDWLAPWLYMFGMPGFVVTLLFGGGFHGDVPTFPWIVVGTLVNAFIYAGVFAIALWIKRKVQQMRPAH